MNIHTPVVEPGVEVAGPSDRIMWECDICGNVMLDLHCKLRCTNCGFMRDCSDP